MHTYRYFLLLTLVAPSLYLSAATVRIKNLSKEPVLALVNDQTSAGWSEEKKDETTSLFAAMTFGTFGFTIPGMLIGLATGIFSERANVKLIKPGESRYFNTELSPVKKVAFFRIMPKPPRKYQTSNENKAYKIINYLLKTYGFPPLALDKKISEKEAQKQEPAASKGGSALATGYFSPTAQLYTLFIPQIETFTIKPDIGRLVVEARIAYRGWGNAKRV